VANKVRIGYFCLLLVCDRLLSFNIVPLFKKACGVLLVSVYARELMENLLRTSTYTFIFFFEYFTVPIRTIEDIYYNNK